MEKYKLFIFLNNKTLVFDDINGLDITFLQEWLNNNISANKAYTFEYNTRTYVINKNAVQYIEFEEMKSYEDRTNV